MNVGQMRSKHLIAAVLLIIVIALGTGIYFITKEKPEAEPSESLIDKVRGIADSYGSGVGYEINSWTDNEAWASIYLEAENEPIPFENFYFQMTDNDWSMKSWSSWSVPSPSKALTVTDYSIHTTMVTQDIQTFSYLDFIFPQVRNSSNWPAFVGSVELKLENPSDRYWRSYSTVGHSIEGIVSPWGTAWVSHGGGPISINWYRNGHDNLLPATTILRMDHLEGKTFEITITLKDGAETVLAENTFTHTF